MGEKELPEAEVSKLSASGFIIIYKLHIIAELYQIVLQRQNQVLLSFLKVRAVVNGREIYPLANNRPVVVKVTQNNPRIVITDGYHISKPAKISFTDADICCFKVECAINDTQFYAVFAVMAIAYLLGMFTGFILLKAIAFLPIAYLLAFYYMNRKDFFRLVPVRN